MKLCYIISIGLLQTVECGLFLEPSAGFDSLIDRILGPIEPEDLEFTALEHNLAMQPKLGSLFDFLNPFPFFVPQLLKNVEIPNVTLSDTDCLVTIDLKSMDVNTTSVRVYSTTKDIVVEITNTQEMSLDSDEEDLSSEEQVNESSELEAAPDLGDDSDDIFEKLFNLRGASHAMSSFQTVRSFPAPEGCNMTSDASKATVVDGHKLLLKFPKSSAEDATDTAIVRSALAIPGPGLLRRLFGREAKVPVPLVRYDEF